MENLSAKIPLAEKIPLVEITYESITVDERGQEIQRQTYHAQQFIETLQEGVSLELVAIPGGFFRMGSRSTLGYPDECPQHNVRVRPFFIAQYPVTQAQWKAVMGWLPPCRCPGEQKPVDRVSWFDAVEFCENLSEQTGRDYRLLSEAEWEYACRAGTSTPFAFGPTITTDLVNFVGDHTFLQEPKGIYRHVSNEARTYPPNAFGVYDMHGNVWEWCSDTWHDTYDSAPTDGGSWESPNETNRVLRGGSWHETPGLCRSASRLQSAPGEAEDLFGFRIALSSLERCKTHTKGHPLRKKKLGNWFKRTLYRLGQPKTR